MNELLAMAKEVREICDHKEAARLLQSGNWIIVRAAIQDENIVWVMIRI